ncbi:MAG: bacterioferritin [Myxococcota bacterium]
MAPKAKSPDIVKLLNDVLTAELTAINQYFVHAKMCDNWGFERLAKKIRGESIEEMVHAEEIVERILYLEGIPNLQRIGKVSVGETVKEQFELDLAMEMDALERFNAGVAQCRDAGDNGTRLLLEKMLHDEEEHVDWLEAQLELMERVGVERYLAEQIHE